MTDTSTLELTIGGMTCAACANRVERKLNRLDGVTATVNFATEIAHVEAPTPLEPQQLIDTVSEAGYTATVRASDTATGGDDRALRRRLLVAAALTAPVMLLAMVPPLQFAYWQWFSLALTVPVYGWCAWPFHRNALLNLRHGTATMDTLVSLGTTAAFSWSVWAVCFGGAGGAHYTHSFALLGHPQHAASSIYFEVAAGVTTFLLLGRMLEHQARRRAGAALRQLLDLAPARVTALRNGREVEVPLAALRVGDEFLARPGERIATDGVVLDGTAAVDASLLTGESVPVQVAAGDHVTGATVNTDGRLRIRATRIGADTRLAQITRLVEAAQTGKAQVQRLADRIAGIFVPVVLAIAAITLAGWWLAARDPATGAICAVAVLVVACPCALGLATPTALLVGSGHAASFGILLRGPETLEGARRIRTILLDKTGTVTTGRMTVAEVSCAEGTSRSELLRAAGAVERASEHPLGRAVAAAAGDAPAVDDFVNYPGRGAAGTVDGRRVVLGKPELLAEFDCAMPAELDAARARADARGESVVAVGWHGSVRGLISIADTVRPTSADAVARLRALGLTPVLLTGDREAVARRVAAEVGIDRVIAGVHPERKVAAVRELQRAGEVVAMVGDGVNDAAALAQADLGIAMGGGSDIAVEASDITLVHGDLLAAVDAVRLSRATLHVITANLCWAFGYNVAAIPVAAIGLLNPMLAGALMAVSSWCVVLNSLVLYRFQPVSARP